MLPHELLLKAIKPDCGLVLSSTAVKSLKTIQDIMSNPRGIAPGRLFIDPDFAFLTRPTNYGKSVFTAMLMHQMMLEESKLISYRPRFYPISLRKAIEEVNKTSYGYKQPERLTVHGNVPMLKDGPMSRHVAVYRANGVGMSVPLKVNVGTDGHVDVLEPYVGPVMVTYTTQDYVKKIKPDQRPNKGPRKTR